MSGIEQKRPKVDKSRKSEELRHFVTFINFVGFLAICRRVEDQESSSRGLRTRNPPSRGVKFWRKSGFLVAGNRDVAQNSKSDESGDIHGLLRARVVNPSTSGLLRHNRAQASLWLSLTFRYPIVTRFRLISSGLPCPIPSKNSDDSGQRSLTTRSYPGLGREVFDRALFPGSLAHPSSYGPGLKTEVYTRVPGRR